MKATLEFNLPEQQHEFEEAIHADEIVSALNNFRYWLRGNIKHGDTIMVSWDEVWQRLHEDFETLGEIVWG